MTKNEEKKMIYKVGDIAKYVSIGTHTVRFWAKKFPHIENYRIDGKIRYYNINGLREFEKIKTLIYEKGMKIDGIRKIIRNNVICPKIIDSYSKIIEEDLLFTEHQLCSTRKSINTKEIIKLAMEIKQDLRNLLSEK